VKRKPRAVTVIGRTSRWAVLAILLSVLFAQQAWGAIACHCGSHSALTASLNECGPRSEEPTDAPRSTCHSDASHREDPADPSHSGDHRDVAEISSARPVIVAANPGDLTRHSAVVSCCCMAQASVPEASIASVSTQQPIPIQSAPAIVLPGASVTGASAHNHGPPRSVFSRPLYIVQSSLLI